VADIASPIEQNPHLAFGGKGNLGELAREFLGDELVGGDATSVKTLNLLDLAGL